MFHRTAPRRMTCQIFGLDSTLNRRIRRKSAAPAPIVLTIVCDRAKSRACSPLRTTCGSKVRNSRSSLGTRRNCRVVLGILSAACLGKAASQMRSFLAFTGNRFAQLLHTIQFPCYLIDLARLSDRARASTTQLVAAELPIPSSS